MTKPSPLCFLLHASLSFKVQVLPGVPSDCLDPTSSVAGTDYAQALLDFQEALAKHLSKHTTSGKKNLLQIHLIGWQGRSNHTLSLLQAFSPTTSPTTRTTGTSTADDDADDGAVPSCNLYIGLDPTVSFSKATHLHKLAFEVPLECLVLETSQIIPLYITKRLGRQAVPHAAWWPFVVEAVVAKRHHHNQQLLDEEEEQQALAAMTQLVTKNIQSLYPALSSSSA